MNIKGAIMYWQKVTIFIYSTFNDMYTERNLRVNKTKYE